MAESMSEICPYFLPISQLYYTSHYRAVARYVTTVNQLYISLLILGYLRYLPRLCGKRVVGCTVNSEARAAWNLSFYYVNYRYSAVIALGKSNEY